MSTPRKTKGARPRIGVDLHTLEGLHQGSRTHCYELFSRVVQHMPEADFSFLVDTARWDNAYTAIFSASNAEVVAMPHKPSPVRLLHQLPALVRKHGIDLLHTQYICPPFVAAQTAVTIHDILCNTHPQYFPLRQRLIFQTLFRLAAARSALVFTVSDYSRERIETLYRVPAQRMATLYNAVDTARFHPGTEGLEAVAALGLAPGGYLLSVGRLEPRKNHAGLLRAYAQLPQPRPRLVIVGQRDFHYQEIFRLRDELKLQDDVLVLENVDDALLPALYRHARAVLYVSFAEGFGLPVVEAMASGTPVITSNTTSLPEVAGDAAVLVDPHSVESILAGLHQLLSGAEKASALRERGLLRAQAFSWDTSAGVLADTYRAYFFAG